MDGYEVARAQRSRFPDRALSTGIDQEVEGRDRVPSSAREGMLRLGQQVTVFLGTEAVQPLRNSEREP